MNLHPRVVVAEPDPQQRARIVELVEDVASKLALTISIHQATDGATAIAICTDQRPALLICEVLLPNLSGLALLRRLRGEHIDETVVIFVTDLGRDTDRYWGLRNGAKAYVTKPFDDVSLRKPVEEALKRYRDDARRPIG